MKRRFTLLYFTGLAISFSIATEVSAQCGAGYTAAELNWDHLDYLPSNNTRYTSFYPTTAFPYTQNFALATRRLTVQAAPQANIILNGENGTNTAHAGSFAAAGDDVQFTTTTSASTNLRLSFDADVANVRFSLFDIDNNQRATITAVNGAGVAQVITAVRANATSGVAIAGSGTASASATGPNTGYANNDNRGTINITVSGSVRILTIVLTNGAGDVWLSDIDACVTGTLATNYQQISRPFTGQPQYVLAVVNNNTYYVDPASGRGYFLFNEPGHNRLNSMAYDPYERIVYYTYSLTGGNNPRNDKTLKKYDVDAKTISVVIPNVNTFGIPTYESGVESGAATFYGGSLYLGIEGYTASDNSGNPYAAGRKSTIWKIDFDAAGNAVPPATQVWGVTSDDGVDAQNIHDWSDFGISDGILTDFDGSGSGDIDYYQFNMFTGVTTNYAPVGLVPRQVSIGWDEKLYNVDATISLYNGTNACSSTRTIFAPLGPTMPTGGAASWGDAAGPYRPFLDFGDAPASYDPDPWSPACHDTLTPTVSDTRTYMRLGPNEDVEWLKRGFTTVEDNYEDGIPFVPIFSPVSNRYRADLTVFNNTDSNATVCAWLDFNGNGTFDPAEGIVPITITPSPLPQVISLNWPTAPSVLPSGSYTYLRVRITSQSYNMTAANATGYYDRGEVEDYRVVVDNSVLHVTLADFEATVQDNSRVSMRWTATESVGFTGYEVERSVDGNEWAPIGFVPPMSHTEMRDYKLTDNDPFKGQSFYRLKLIHSDGPARYSSIRPVHINAYTHEITLFPNPAQDRANLQLYGQTGGQPARIVVTDMSGTKLSEQRVQLLAGINTISLPLRNNWLRGAYLVHITTGERTETRKLILRR